MLNPPLLTNLDATISFAKKVLFENLQINIFLRDRISHIGKNGAGKTTLMNAVYGRMDFDCGERWMDPKSSIGYLEQSEEITPNLTVVDYIKGELQLDDNKLYLIDIVCTNLQIDQSALTQNLSGGQKRRVHLAKSLVMQPDILLLDEPTNHLDLNIIEWLEEYLQSYKGALLVISHDRKFLEKVSNKVFWLRAGTMKINPHGYKNFDEWSQTIIEHEDRELENLEKKVDLESGWLQTGVTGRRKRNIGRLHYLQELRQKLEAQRRLTQANKNHIRINSEKEFDDDAPQVIASFNNVSKKYDRAILDKFSLKILRGEKIGIIGNNGSGKSTFLKMLVGQDQPDAGTVKLARDIEFSYFDQQRSAIKPHASLQEILCETGSDYVNLPNGKTRHICSYLKDFLFDPQDVKTSAGTLSGGQQNRLLLAKTLANPGNFLILDEPTNDLDMDSLDMLQDYLEQYQGTLIVVSHDRDFLDNVATNILAFEGDGDVVSYLGGYSDYLDYRQSRAPQGSNKSSLEKSGKNSDTKNEEAAPKKSYTSTTKIKAELDRIPQKIEVLEKKILALNEEILTTENRALSNLAHISIEISRSSEELDKLEARWEELEKELNGKK